MNSGVEKYGSWNKNFTRGVNRRLEQPEERISKPEDKSTKVIQPG